MTTPDEITEYLGIEPTSTGWKGERLSSRNPRSALLDVNVWTFESPLSGAGSIEEQIDALLEVLVSEAHFDLLPGDCEVEIRVALTAVELGRLHNISAAAVKRAAAMGASISIDAYSREL